MVGKVYKNWNKEEAEAFCEKVYDYALSNDGCYSISDAVSKCGGYETIIYYFSQKFGEEFESIKTCKEIIKARCLRKGMNMETNATMTIFNLVNNFGMVNTNSKSEQTINATVNTPVTKWADNADHDAK